MRHYGLEIPEGSDVTNLSAPNGTADPSNSSIGELFFRSDINGGTLRVHNGTTWGNVADGTSFLELTGGTLTGELIISTGAITASDNTVNHRISNHLFNAASLEFGFYNTLASFNSFIDFHNQTPANDFDARIIKLAGGGFSIDNRDGDFNIINNAGASDIGINNQGTGDIQLLTNNTLRVTVADTVLTSTTDMHINNTTATLFFDDQLIVGDGLPEKRIICNDGGGNFMMKSGTYFSGDNLYGTTGDGAAIITQNFELANGLIRLETAVIGTADAVISPDATISMSNGLINLTCNNSITLTSSGTGVAASINGSASQTNILNLVGASVSGNTGLHLQGKSALTSGSADTFLRLNSASTFTNGVFTPGNFRCDGQIRLEITRGITDVLSVGGGFGTIATNGISGHGGFAGYNIDGRAVFMHDGASSTRIYNDVDNANMIICTHNADVTLYYNNLTRLSTSNNGVDMTGLAVSTQSSTTQIAVLSNATSTSYTGNVLDIRCARAASTLYHLCRMRSSGTGDTEFRFRGDGNGFADGSFAGGGADYAEYFEWDDGNPGSPPQDRVGYSVKLIGTDGKIALAQVGDTPIGVISANPTVTGDGANMKWKDKYLLDDFNRPIMEDYQVVEWTETPPNEYIGSPPILDISKNYEPIQHSYATDAIPGSPQLVPPGNAVYTTQQRKKLNPVFDPDLVYIPREERQEWGCVGLMGKLRIRSGQPTAASWVKLRDITVGVVEEWLIK